MSSELSVFAARLRDFIGIASEDTLYLEPSEDAALNQHLDTEFNGMAIVLFGLQFLRNSAYRKFCELRGVTPDSITHWTQIPAVPTFAFKEWELTSLAPDQRTAVFHSSGTTEQRPSRHLHSAESLALYEASLWPWFDRNVIREFALSGSKFQAASLTPSVALAPNSSLVHMFESIRQRVNAPETMFLGSAGADGSWTLDMERTVAVLNTVVQDKVPLLLMGTAFSFVHLVDNLAERKLRFNLPEGSVVMETGGYKGRSRSLPKPALHMLISQCLGVSASHIVCEYGMSELSSQAYDTAASETRNQKPETRDFRFPPWARAQVISSETGRQVDEGEAGLLRVCDLANVFSVMAVQTEDLAIRRGTGFQLLGRAEQSEPRGCSLMAP